MQKKVSIALATYNGSKFLKEQLNSLCSQEMLPYEIVASDDCSSDDTVNILNEYKDKLKIHIIQSEKNIGVNKNFERAILACSGDYVMICDQDDIWFPEKIKVSFDYMRALEDKWGQITPIIISSGTTPFTDLSGLNKSITYSGEVVTEFNSFVFANIYNQGCTLMLNRALIQHLKPFPENFKDIPYDFYIAMVGTMIGERCHIKRPLMYYRNHSNNVIGRAMHLSKRELFKLKLSNISFSLYKCPQSYLKCMELVSELHKDEIPSSERKSVLNSCIAFFRSDSTIKKISVVLRMNNVSLKKKIEQISILILTTPSRIFLKQPYSISLPV